MERCEREVQLQGVVELGVQGAARTSEASGGSALRQLQRQVEQQQHEIDRLREGLLGASQGGTGSTDIGGAAAPAGTFSDSADHLQDETVAYESINAYQDEIDNMVACILDGAEPVISLIDSQHNIAAIAALYQSARENRMVSL